MNKHLQMVRAFHDACGFPQAGLGSQAALSETDIITYQAMLMEQGAELLKSLKTGELTEILLCLVDLSYYALAAVAIQGAEVQGQSLNWQHDGKLISIMRLIVAKIEDCTDGQAENYSALYYACVELGRRFLNADFDKAFSTINTHHMTRLQHDGECIYRDIEKIRKAELLHEPDLSDCLFE